MDFLTEIAATEPLTEPVIEAVTEAATEAVKMEFNPMAFVDNLKYMGVGMLVIFVIIGLIILVTKLVSALPSKEK